MLQKIQSRRSGFTLVEIMIVVTIIAILAAVALPELMRSIKRSKATMTLDICRQLDSARIQWVAESRTTPDAGPAATDLARYIRKGTRLETELLAGGATDALGAAITLPTINTSPKVATSTINTLSDVVDPATFWGEYKEQP